MSRVDESKSAQALYKRIMTPRAIVVGTWILFLLLAHSPDAAASGGSAGLMTTVCLDFATILALILTPIQTLGEVGSRLLYKLTGTSKGDE